jgi:membrane protease YdiL (CAAX protease family)
MTNTAGDTSNKTPRDVTGRSLPGPRGEAALVVLGFYLGIFFYYSRLLPLTFVGLSGITCTAFYLAYSLKYVNPTSLPALHVTRQRAGLYLLLGLVLILPGWFFDSLYSYLTGSGWLTLRVTTSAPLILSILAVATCEELFFRGYVLGRLKALGGNRWARILLVCALFIFYKVLIHSWEGWPLAAYAEFFVFGAFKMLFETWLVDQTGSVVTPIVIHIGWDLIMFQAYTGLPPWAL